VVVAGRDLGRQVGLAFAVCVVHILTSDVLLQVEVCNVLFFFLPELVVIFGWRDVILFTTHLI